MLLLDLLRQFVYKRDKALIMTLATVISIFTISLMRSPIEIYIVVYIFTDLNRTTEILIIIIPHSRIPQRRPDRGRTAASLARADSRRLGRERETRLALDYACKCVAIAAHKGEIDISFSAGRIFYVRRWPSRSRTSRITIWLAMTAAFHPASRDAAALARIELYVLI